MDYLQYTGEYNRDEHHFCLFAQFLSLFSQKTEKSQKYIMIALFLS